MPRQEERPHRIEEPSRLLPRPGRDPGLSHLRLSQLLSLASEKATLLAKKEIELAKADAEEDLRQEAKMAAGLGISGVSALLTLMLLLVAVVFALVAAGLPGWGSSLIVAAAVLLVGTISGILGWRKRVREPMVTTRRSIEEGITWAKELR